jgi:hypothetical protein
MRLMLLPAILLQSAIVLGALNTKEEPFSVGYPEDGPLPLASIARQIAIHDMGQAKWDKFVKDCKERFQDWSVDRNNNNLKQFLDDNLLILVTSALSGKTKAIQEFCYWLSLYDALGQPVPAYLRDNAEKYRACVQAHLKNFNWDEVASAVRVRCKG